MGNDMFNDEQLAHAELVQKETEEALGFWKERALKAEAALSALSRARETDGAVREAAEIRKHRTTLLSGLAYIARESWWPDDASVTDGVRDHVGKMRDAVDALSSPPRPGAEAPITCEEVGCPTCCPSPRAETKDDDKGGAA